MKQLFLPILLMLLTIPAVGVAGDLEQVKRLLDSGENAAATKKLEKVLASSPDDTRALFIKGRLLVEQGETEDAIVVFQRLIERHPQVPEPYNNLAALYVEQGRLEEAKDVLEKGMHTNNSYATIYENLSAVYVEMARKSYVKALRLDRESEQPRLHTLVDLHPSSTGANMVAAVANNASEVEKAASLAKSKEPQSELLVAVNELSGNEVLVDAPVGMSDVDTQVIQTLQRWAQAWSQKDADKYISFYRDNYSPSNDLSHAQWAQQRDQRLQRPSWIDVSLSDFEIYPLDSGSVKVRLRQRYDSDTYQDITLKEMELGLTEKGWVIFAEENLKTLQ